MENKIHTFQELMDLQYTILKILLQIITINVINNTEYYSNIYSLR